MHTLAIDIGSSSVKIGLFSGRRLLATSRAAVRTIMHGNHVEVPADALLRTLIQSLRDFLRDKPKPDVIAYDTFSPGLVMLDHHDRILAGAITHQDRRSIAEAHALTQKFSADHFLRVTGNHPIPGGIASTSLLWIKKHQPHLLKKEGRVGLVGSVVLRCLTGEWRTDPANAAFMGLWDIRRNQWDHDLYRAVGISLSSLPQVVFADSILGHTLPAISRQLGIAPGTPVIGGLIDTSAALLATPLNPGQLVHNAGSTDVLALCLNHPRPGATIITRPLGTGVIFPQRWLAVSTIAAAGSAVNWARSALFFDYDDATFSRLLASQCRELSRSLPRPSSLIMTPYLAGDRMQIDAPPATLSGLTLSTTREDILCALLAGLIRKSCDNFSTLRNLNTISPTVYQTGGAIALARAMHAHWPEKKLHFRTISGDTLTGLAILALKII